MRGSGSLLLALGVALAAASAHAFNDKHLKQLLETKSCSRCDLQNAILTEAQLQDADLAGAQLQNAILTEAQLQDADLAGAQLQGAFLAGAQLQDADLAGAQLQGAILAGTQLQGAVLTGAELHHAILFRAQFQDTQLAFTDLTYATYAPVGVPHSYVEGITGLSTVIIPYQAETGEVVVTGLVQLRELLQKAGLRDREREATYAIEYNQTHHMLSLWRQRPVKALEAAIRLVAFEWPVGYGLHRGRALLILLVSIGGFALIYVVPLVAVASGWSEERPEPTADYREPANRAGMKQPQPEGFSRRLRARLRSAFHRGGIYRVWPKERLEPAADGAEWHEQVKVERLRPRGWWGLKRLLHALQFSLLSAFHLGWRELNVGTWLAGVQTQEYILRATGWVRAVAGVQSLISVYLLAIWALTYFGRPFQ